MSLESPNNTESRQATCLGLFFQVEQFLHIPFPLLNFHFILGIDIVPLIVSTNFSRTTGNSSP